MRKKRMAPRLGPIVPAAALLAGSFSLFLSAPQRVQADDRELLRESSDRPYIFLLFDVSSSMRTQAAFEPDAETLMQLGPPAGPLCRLFADKFPPRARPRPGR